MLQTLFSVAAVVMVASAAPSLVLPPGVPESCRYTYPNCPAVSLEVIAQPLLDLHNANVALERMKAAQQATFIPVPAAFVPIIGPSGVIDQEKTEGPSGTVLHN